MTDDIRGRVQGEVLESEEAYFLRRINGRSNSRLLYSVANEFGLNIPSVNDPCSYDPCRIAAPTTETYINDMIRLVSPTIDLLHGCKVLYMALTNCKTKTKTKIIKQAEGW